MIQRGQNNRDTAIVSFGGRQLLAGLQEPNCRHGLSSFEVNANTTDEIRVLSEQLPRMMFVCLPIFALLLKLLYRRYYYFDHLIHALHLHTAAYLALALMLPFERLAEESWLLLAIQLIVFGYMILYLTVSQRQVYQTLWLITLAKTAALFFAYTMVLGVLIEAASHLESAGGIEGLWQ